MSSLTRQGAQAPGVARVAVSDGEIGDEPWHAGVENGEVLSARLVAEGASEPTFAQAARTNDILPKNTSSMLSSNIRIIRLPESGCRSFDALFMRAWSILSCMAQTVGSRVAGKPDGWRRPTLRRLSATTAPRPIGKCAERGSDVILTDGTTHAGRTPEHGVELRSRWRA
jgi:hypothetical protein